MNTEFPTKKYSKYTREMRVQLIRLVDQQHLSTAHAARLLGIKQTSACRIMKSYHQNHKIFERKADRLSREGAAAKPQQNSIDLLGAQLRQPSQENNNQNISPSIIGEPTLCRNIYNHQFQQNMGREISISEQATNNNERVLQQMCMGNGAYLPVYYSGYYPLMCNYYI